MYASACVEAHLPRGNVCGRRHHRRRDCDVPWLFGSFSFHKTDIEAICTALTCESLSRRSIREYVRKTHWARRAEITAVLFHSRKDFSIFFKQRHRHLCWQLNLNQRQDRSKRPNVGKGKKGADAVRPVAPIAARQLLGEAARRGRSGCRKFGGFRTVWNWSAIGRIGHCRDDKDWADADYLLPVYRLHNAASPRATQVSQLVRSRIPVNSASKTAN